jgi:hypothetical protein
MVVQHGCTECLSVSPYSKKCLKYVDISRSHSVGFRLSMSRQQTGSCRTVYFKTQCDILPFSRHGIDALQESDELETRLLHEAAVSRMYSVTTGCSFYYRGILDHEVPFYHLVREANFKSGCNFQSWIFTIFHLFFLDCFWEVNSFLWKKTVVHFVGCWACASGRWAHARGLPQSHGAAGPHCRSHSLIMLGHHSTTVQCNCWYLFPRHSLAAFAHITAKLFVHNIIGHPYPQTRFWFWLMGLVRVQVSLILCKIIKHQLELGPKLQNYMMKPRFALAVRLAMVRR